MRARLRAGRRFGRYRLDEKLGEGGMAIVYRATAQGPEGFERQVVVKCVRPELSRDPQFVKGLAQEARVAALLHHPGIVQVFELGEVDGEFYLAMEYIDGVDLATLFSACQKQRRTIPPGLVCYVVSEVAAALGYAHALRDDRGRLLEIVHRDISLSNVMVASTGAVKLVDFGIAKAIDGGHGAEQTRSGVLKGKLSYFSPELANGEAIDGRSDLFALGVVMYECLTLRRLFRGANDFDTLRLIREANVAPPSQHVPQLPREIEAVTLRLLARTKNERFTSGDEVVAALSPIVHRLGADAAGLRQLVADLGAIPVVTHGEGSVTRSSGEVSRSPTRPTRPRRPAVGAALAAVIALSAGAGIWALAQHHRAAPSLLAPQATSLAPQATSLAPAAAAPEAPAPAATIHLVVDGPAGVAVDLDGRRLGTTPLAIELARQPGKRKLSLHRAGFESEAREIDGDRDAVVDARLRKKEAKRKPPVLMNPFR